MRNIERGGGKERKHFPSISREGRKSLYLIIIVFVAHEYFIPALVAYFNATLYTILGIASGRRALNMRGTRTVGLEETIYEDRCCIIEAMVDTSHTGCIPDREAWLYRVSRESLFEWILRTNYGRSNCDQLVFEIR